MHEANGVLRVDSGNYEVFDGGIGVMKVFVLAKVASLAHKVNPVFVYNYL
jgi:hypothetical protein